jgi:hypothetical protein
MVDYSHITLEAGMVIKKASGDDSTLQKGARKSFDGAVLRHPVGNPKRKV